MKNVKFEGIMPAIITPFNEDNKTINVQAVKDIIDWQLGQGADGFYVLGATGEGVLMGREERELMCETAVKHVAGRKPIICHIASINFLEAVELAKHAEKTGADALAAVPPFYFGYSDEEIFNYYKKLAGSVNIPVIIYYHPAAQANMRPELIAKIFEIDNITGVKWSSSDYYSMIKLKDMTHGEMNIINGPDETLILGLTSGADAGVGATYNCMLPEFIRLYKAFKAGDIAKAQQHQFNVNRVINVLIKYGVIPGVKAGVQMLGYAGGNAKFPFPVFDAETRANFERDMKAAGIPFAE